jgi:hypothetical protein
MTDGEFIYGSDLSDRIRLVCAEGDVDAAVAFWGHKVREHLFPNWEERRIRIVCDISMGGNSQKSLKALGAPNNENLRVLDRLHAKVFWSPVGAVVCSANASANGIGSLGEPAGNLEAGVYYQPYSAGWHAAGKFVTEAFDHGSVIDAEQLARAPVITGDPGVRIGPKGLNLKVSKAHCSLLLAQTSVPRISSGSIRSAMRKLPIRHLSLPTAP